MLRDCKFSSASNKVKRLSNFKWHKIIYANSERIEIKRNTVRLGEHDLRTTSDGQHVDIGIAYSDVHNEYDEEIDLNDIAIVHLAHDVEFNGRLKRFYSRITLPTI